MFDATANVPTEAQQLAEAHDPRYANAGRDTSVEALNGREQSTNMNLSRRPENQPGYVHEAAKKYGDYSEMPAIRGHRSGWIY